MTNDRVAELARQIVFSRATFGPSERMNGVLAHIAKEMEEVRKEADPIARAREWVDIVILARDGLWRALAAGLSKEDETGLAMIALAMIDAKQERNEQRDWPDWRTQSADKAIEHDRSKET